MRQLNSEYLYGNAKRAILRGLAQSAMLAIGAISARATADGVTAAPSLSPPPPLVSGAYLVHAAGCADCHSKSEDQYMSGGVVLATPFGTITTPNITPEPTTGIGTWTYADFERALRKGRGPHLKFYYPVFPFRSYAKISDADMHKMWDYLRSIPPIVKPNVEPQMKVPRVGSVGWELLFWWNPWFVTTPEQKVINGTHAFEAIAARGPEWNRGAYLAESLTHCAECHTPRDPYLGKLDRTQWMAGGVVEHEVVPNITPDVETGRGGWTEADWDRFLKSGYSPTRTHPLSEKMAEVVQNTAALTEADRHALIVYLRALTPIKRQADAP